MSAELERRLGDAFERLPRPSAEVTARARRAALATVPTRRRRVPRRLLVAIGAAVAATAVGAAALAAGGRLHVDLGARSPRPAEPVRSRLTLPPDTQGMALVAGGRLWLATRGGLRIEGMPATMAELSPRALYAVVGLGSSLVAFAPGQRRAWTHRPPGTPLAAAWTPDGLKIAYVVRTRRGAQLRLIEGDGDHDRLLARRVAAVKPAWFGDSLRIAYARASGRSVMFDLRHGTATTGRRLPLGRRAVARLGDRVAVAVRRPDRIVELRVASREGRSRLLLRVRAGRSPLAISWR
jgi:hypothetical protein